MKDHGISLAQIPRSAWAEADALFAIWATLAAKAEDTPYYPDEGVAQAKAWDEADVVWERYQDYIRDAYEASLPDGMRAWIDKLRDEEHYRRGA